MHINRHELFDSLAGEKAAWNKLARDVPFRTWQWCETWWRHYGCKPDGRPLADRDLFLLAAWNDDGELIAVAPWYRQTTRGGTRIVKFLGDGEVCSEYPSVLCRPEDEPTVAVALAEWLTVANDASKKESAEKWDRLELTSIDSENAAVEQLLQALENRGNRIVRDRAMCCWRLELPPTWDDYIKAGSKKARNRLRYAERTWLQSGKVKLHTAPGDNDIDAAFDILVDLHQRRWQSQGLPGCFASPQFAAFHYEVWKQFSADGRALIRWLEFDGKPLAADYALLGGRTTYGYQSGIDPDQLEIQPGQLMNFVTLRTAIESGYRAYDFLRGDEQYKGRLRAEPRPMFSAYVVPRLTRAELRYAAWNAGRQMRGWAKRGLQVARELREGRGSNNTSNEDVKRWK